MVRREKSLESREQNFVYHGPVARRLHRTLWYSGWEGAAAAVQHNARAQPPGPQAREPLSLWTEAWPICAAVSVQHNARARAWSGPPSRSTSARIKCEVGPRCGRSFSCARDGAHDFGNNSLFRLPVPCLFRTLVAHGPSTCQMSSPYSRKRAPACARCALCSSRTVHSLTIPRLLPSTVRNASVYRVITQAS